MGRSEYRKRAKIAGGAPIPIGDAETKIDPEIRVELLVSAEGFEKHDWRR